MSKGVSEQDLIKKFGHDLVKLKDFCVDYRFNCVDGTSLVAYLHNQHKSFEFRYMKSNSIYVVESLDNIFAKLSALDQSVDMEIGASASRGLVAGGAWIIPEGFADWRA